MVGIVILNYNNPQITIDCIESIEKLNTYPCKIVVVDNASTDNSVSVLDEYLKEHADSEYHKQVESDQHPAMIPKYSLVVAKKNCGYAKGNNIGCFYFEDDEDINYILILNNDTLFIDDIIPPMAKFQKEHADCAICNVLLLHKDGNTIEYNTARKNCSIGELLSLFARINKLYQSYNQKNQILRIHPELLSKSNVEIEIPMGSCLLLKKETFKKVGYFDPHTFLYFEENILYKKFQKIGLKNYLLPQQKLIHIGSATIKKTRFSYFQEIQKTHSSYYYGLHYSGMSVLFKPVFVLMYYYNLLLLAIRHVLIK